MNSSMNKKAQDIQGIQDKLGFHNFHICRIRALVHKKLQLKAIHKVSKAF